RNGYEALKLLKSKNYDLMITDLEMPQISGYELIESARNDIKLEDIPI
ncbi:MAG: response regulator, partial [Aliifodinibius sp.]|nr:response regulator [Fodinibius sp.]NIV15633.1 response regulator [Fodinibius sp.]NIY29477.1 response regulator [Fodinibius sp.]